MVDTTANPLIMFSNNQISLRLLFVLLMICVHVYGQELDKIRPKKCKKEFSCASCNEVRVCLKKRGGWEEQLVFSCNSSTPYCDDATGTCTSVPSLECAPTDSFTCVRDGVFPDPSNCKQYHVCLNYTSYHYTCDFDPYYYYYNSDKEKCDNNVGCYTLDCSGKSGTKVAYGHDASIFAYCVNGSAYIVDRCPGNYELSSQTCLPKCDSERIMPDVDDCTKYYKCTEVSYTYTLIHEDCPSGDGFDSIYYRCVSLSTLPQCKPPHTIGMI